jgi:hypothetical protein
MPTPDPIWTNWEFWSVIVAFGALVKSEFPPVYSLFKRPRLELEVHNRIIITHTAGNPNVNLFLSLSNVGNCDIRIKSINLLISPRDREPFELPVQTYYPILTEDKPVIFSRFKLPTKMDWSYLFSFFKPFSRNDEDLNRKLSSAIKEDILAKRAVPGFDQNSVAEAYAQKVADFVEFFKNRFKWDRGEYELTVTVLTDRADVKASKKFRFTLFDSDAHNLRSFADQYKIGLGVFYFDIKQQPPLFIPITEELS